MASPEHDENEGGINKGELDGLEEEQAGAISEQENSEGPEEEESFANELDESGDTETEPSADRDEKQAELSGNELDELEEEQTGTISGQENSEGLEEEQLSGDELDDLDDTEAEPIPVSKNAHHPDRRGSRKKGLWVASAIGLCVLIGIGYLYLKEQKSRGLPGQESEAVAVTRISIPEEQVLLFDSFIIPISENREFTYISLSISFKLPNKEIKRQMTEKKKELRGIIYDILTGEISKRKEVPRLEGLKKLIIGGVNSALSSGEIHEVYVTKFLAV